MTESRTERTPNTGLLALYNADGRLQGWGWPYWNQLQLDALLAGLADAPRTGAAPISTPSAPTAAPDTTGGHLADGTYEVVQTFVDEYGRETAPSAVASAGIAAGIADPVLPATLLVSSGTTGFAGGQLEVWFTWTDADSRETLASPAATVQMPYRAAGLYNQVKVTFPSTPAAAGAAGANVYIRHRSGYTVLAAVLLEAAEDHVQLESSIMANCSQSLPLSNTTGGTGVIEITGSAQAGGDLATAGRVRFYIRKQGQAWTAAERRLKLSGADEWDPTLVSYPLVFSGAPGEMAPGYPPSVSQVQSIRPVDLATEVTGVLPASSLPGSESTQALNKTCAVGGNSDFAITGIPAECQVGRVYVGVVGGPTPDWNFEIFSDSGRTVLAYKAINLAGDLDDRIPWEWIGGTTMYCRIHNNDDANITDADVTISFRR